MDSFTISLNPTGNPTKLKFVYNAEDDKWEIFQQNQNDGELVGGFYGFPPA